jgi:hypothetical protein
MNKNAIYTLKADPQKTGRIDEWSALPLKRMKLYAKRVRADLVVVDESKIREMNIPSTLNTFQAVNMLKFYILDNFSRSEYERMLFLDLDILIRTGAENIFDEVECKGIHMTINKNESDDRTYKKLMENHYFERRPVPQLVYESPVYNGGIIYADKPTIERFCKKIPKLKDWTKFFESYNLASNPLFSGDQMNEQHLISLFLAKHHFEVNILDIKWNVMGKRFYGPWAFLWQKPDSNFVHYFGQEGKEVLNKLNTWEKNGHTENLCFYY